MVPNVGKLCVFSLFLMHWSMNSVPLEEKVH